MRMRPSQAASGIPVRYFADSSRLRDRRKLINRATETFYEAENFPFSAFWAFAIGGNPPFRPGSGTHAITTCLINPLYKI